MVAGPSCLCGSEEVHLQVEQVRRGLVWVRRWWLGGICGWWMLAAGASVFRALAGFLWLEGEECLLCVGLSASPGGSSPVFGAGISSPLPLLWPLLQRCVLCRSARHIASAPGGRWLLDGVAAVTAVVSADSAGGVLGLQLGSRLPPARQAGRQKALTLVSGLPVYVVLLWLWALAGVVSLLLAVAEVVGCALCLRCLSQAWGQVGSSEP